MQKYFFLFYLYNDNRDLPLSTYLLFPEIFYLHIYRLGAYVLSFVQMYFHCKAISRTNYVHGDSLMAKGKIIIDLEHKSHSLNTLISADKKYKLYRFILIGIY